MKFPRSGHAGAGDFVPCGNLCMFDMGRFFWTFCEIISVDFKGNKWYNFCGKSVSNELGGTYHKLITQHKASADEPYTAEWAGLYPCVPGYEWFCVPGEYSKMFIF